MEKTEVTFDFTGKRFLIVGASSGIGRQINLEIVKCGGSTLSIARNSERLESLKNQYPEKIMIKSIDVRDKTSMENAVKEYTSKYGKIHGSVYTAGVSRTTVLRSFSIEDAKALMDTNFWGWINLMSVVCKKKFSDENCSHVVIASVAAHKGEAGNFAYNASKAALITSVKTFAKELASRKCRVNSISPGFVATSLTEDYFEKRGFSEQTIIKHLLGSGEPEDISGLALYLLSERAKWITGADFVVDGGYLISD